MICEKCGNEFDDGLGECPHCDDSEEQKECNQPNVAETEKKIISEKESSACAFNSEKVYTKIERDEKGLIKRDGFRMKGINYGPEFDKENMDHVFRTGIVFLVILAIFLVLSFIIGIIYFVDR